MKTSQDDGGVVVHIDRGTCEQDRGLNLRPGIDELFLRTRGYCDNKPTLLVIM